MKLTITGRQITLKDSFKDMVEKKLSKFDRFFGDDAEAFVTVSVQREMQTVEITIRSAGMIYRAEQKSADMLFSLEEAVDAILRQIGKNKRRLAKKLKADAFDAGALSEPETPLNVVKTKKFPIKPMSVEEAILQMDLLGHQFFAFINMDSDDVNVVYRRKAGGYGLLEPTVD